MSIIDQARDALNRLDKSGRTGMFHAAADIHEMGPEAVNAVVRVANLADSLQARGDAPGEYSPGEQSAYRVAAHELRAALEGSEK